MRGNIIAVDMGSVNTAIYQLGANVVLFEPSVVLIDEQQKKKVKAVGSEAKRLIGKTAGKTSTVFPINEGLIVNEKIAAMMLENFLNKITLKKLSLRPQVLLSVPCGLDNDEIKKYLRVFAAAGVYSIDLVESPILTALGLGVPLSESNPCFLVDIGGTSANIAAVSLDGVIAGVNVNMGGRNIDAMIMKHIEEFFNLKIGTLTAESLKIQVASLYENDGARTVISGRDVTSGKPRSVSVCSQDILFPVKIFFDKLFEVIELVLAKLPAEVSAEIRRSGVFFAGGTSRIPGLDDYFKEHMAIKANISDDPEIATVVGGGMVAGNSALLKRIKIVKR